MMHRSRRLVMLTTLAMFLAGCVGTTGSGQAAGNAAPGVGSLPATAAPNGLSKAQLPADAPGIAALLARLPSTVAGQPRTPQLDETSPGRYTVVYGDGRADGRRYAIAALDVSTGDFFQPGWTAGDVVAARPVARDMPQDMEAVLAAGQDGSLVWSQERSAVTFEPGKSVPLFVTAWGTASSAWLFSAQADTPEAVAALVDAFIAAAKGA